MSTLEDRQAEVRARQVQDRVERMERHPTNAEHPHHLEIRLHTGVMVRVHCPGEAHCGLWYRNYSALGGKCGLQLEAEEVGSEFLEWQVGPEYTPPVNPFPIGFMWSGGGSDDPPEIEWWTLAESSDA